MYMSTVRARTTSAQVATVDDNLPDTPPADRITTPSLPQRAISQTLTSTAQLANLLPTGTLLTLQLLAPTFTNNGSCDATVTRPMTVALLVFMTVCCFLASLTDSFKCSDGKVFYGFATFKGMWLFDYPTASDAGLPDLSKYKLRFIDWIHALLSAFVLVALALRDQYVLNCFYPSPTPEIQQLLKIAPLGIGLVSSTLFVVFPTTRHGIGYPVTPGN